MTLKHLWTSRVVLAVALSLVVAGVSLAERSLSYKDLVHRMIDLEYLATLPAPGETCAQWSSYDRGSRYDEQNNRYVGWAANGDGNQVIRKENGLEVMAEMEGPGCLWRVWSALPEKGRVKVYLDGQNQPTLDMPFAAYFTGDQAPLDYPMLSYGLDRQGCRGKNLYYPIPYQKSCKIVAEPGWGSYFHFTYTTFPDGTRLPTFSTELAEQNATELKALDTFFGKKLGTDPAGERAGQLAVERNVTVAAGQTAPVAALDGPRAITAIRVKPVKFAGREDEMAALRQLVLRITFDGAAQPQVLCPLGDFFGTAPGVNLYASLPTGMTKNGFYALWYMPFAKSAKVELLNDGAEARDLPLEIVHAPLQRRFDELAHFYCQWHRDIRPLSEDRFPDWVMLRCQGRGRFCGVMLHVWNPRGGWWGEGDEKFFVDGEKFPSTIGTGSEDYFGYAWGHAGLFQTAYHCQTMTSGNRGHQSVLRWHGPDNVPFQKSFEGCIEKYFGQDRGTLYACTACWYMAPGGHHPIRPAPVARRHGFYRLPPLVAGGFRVLGKPPGQVQTQGMANFKAGTWHKNDHLWWTQGKPGQKLDLALPVQQDGEYELSVVLTKAKDYGIVQFHLDGKKAGEPIDLYNPEVTNTEPIALGTHELSGGDHKLTVEIVGANDKAIKSYMFGVDRIILKK